MQLLTNFRRMVCTDSAVQGTSKERFPGCVKLGEKVAFCLPTAGRRTQFFHPIFAQPGKHSLEVPCILDPQTCSNRLRHGTCICQAHPQEFSDL